MGSCHSTPKKTSRHPHRDLSNTAASRINAQPPGDLPLEEISTAEPNERDPLAAKHHPYHQNGAWVRKRSKQLPQEANGRPKIKVDHHARAAQEERDECK